MITDETREYHAHVYFDETELSTLQLLHAEFRRVLPDVRCEIHESPKGPHPKPYLELNFSEKDMLELRPALMNCSLSRPVLIHRVTGDDIVDHTEHAEWLGGRIDLDIGAFTR